LLYCHYLEKTGGMARMEEPHWQGSAEEYRTIQGLARAKRFDEALKRAGHVFVTGQLGRKHTARLHILLCRMYMDDLYQTGNIAILHGEEAVRLARAVHDNWIQCEAQTLLVRAYYQLLDRDRANPLCQAIMHEVDKNSAVIPGGTTTVLLLRAGLAWLEGDTAAQLDLIEQAEEFAAHEASTMYAQVRVTHIVCLIDMGRLDEAQELFDEFGDCVAAALEWELLRGWLAFESGATEDAHKHLTDVLDIAHQVGNVAVIAQLNALQARIAHERGEHVTAQRLARSAVHKVVGAGRLDLARRFQSWLGHLL
jgi:tetratricopeptide (TPR) repeat protein